MSKLTGSRPLLLVFLTAGLISLLNISHVLVGAFRTPLGHIYLWTGHYYSDYFAYIQVMVQGAKGNWLVENPFATDDFSKTLLAWGPDLLLGKLAGFVGASPFLFYWLAVAVLSFLFALLIFLIIQSLLADKPFYLQFAAFLLSTLAAPFFQVKNGAGLKLVPYSFWYAPSVLFERFGNVPRHLLGQILALLIILILADTFQKIGRLSLAKIFTRTLGASCLLSLLFTFSYLAVVVLVASFISGVILMAIAYLRERKAFLAYCLVLATMLILVLPAGLAVKYFAGFSGALTRCSAWDVSQQLHYPLSFILLTIGPILLFGPFGLVNFLRSLTPLKLLVSFLFLVSWSFFFLPFAPLFGTSNVRFLTPLVYPVFGVLAILGMESLAAFKSKLKKKLIFGGLLLLLLLFLPANKFFFQRQLIFDPYLTYLPLPVYEGLQFLDAQPGDRAVLTAPAGSLGSFLPIFIKKRVYLGREFFTPKFEEKKALVFRFYEGKMGEGEAKQLLLNNGIGFVFWRDMEGFSLENLLSYSFLQQIFNNQRAVIFKVREINN